MGHSPAGETAAGLHDPSVENRGFEVGGELI